MSQDEPFRLDTLEISVSAYDRVVESWSYRIPEDRTLPNAVAILSNGDPDATVSVVISGYVNSPETSGTAGRTAIDRRDALLRKVPTDHVSLETIVLSARCTPQIDTTGGREALSRCPAGRTCNPRTGACVSALFPADTASDSGAEASSVPGGDASPAIDREGPAPDTAVADASTTPPREDARAVVADGEPMRDVDAFRDGDAARDVDAFRDGDAARDGEEWPEASDASPADVVDATTEPLPCVANNVATCAGVECGAARNNCGEAIVCPNRCLAGRLCGADGVHVNSCSFAVAQSCATPGAGRADCAEGGDCCVSTLVPGGGFSRNFDVVTRQFSDPTFRAVVSDFRLDKYEITVGRFRSFVAAVLGGWRPPAASGKHVHLNVGAGLRTSSERFESGWDDAAAGSTLPTAAAAWNAALTTSCNPAVLFTWTAEIAANERRPINCLTWYEAQAFCIWDGGFLPSDAEWNYAASAGSEQRAYPWSAPAAALTIDPSYASYSPSDAPISCLGDGLPGCAVTDLVEVGTKPKGDGRFAQSDLGGNVWEWTLDSVPNGGVPSSCNDCANVTAAENRVVRGGGLGALAPALLSSSHDEDAPASRRYWLGARCARPQ